MGVTARPVRWHLGLSVVMISAVVAPLALDNGFSGCLALTVMVCAAWLIRALARGRVALDRSRIVAAAVAIIVIAVLAFVVGQYPWFPVSPAPIRAQVGGLILFVLSGTLFLTVAHEVDSLALLRRLTWLFILLGGLLVVTQWLPGLPRSVDALMRPDLVGSAFWTWMVAMSVAQALHNERLSLLVRGAALSIGALTLARGFVAFSWVSGWLPPVIALGIVAFLRFPRLAVGAGLLALTPLLMKTEAATAALLEGESYSWSSRLEAWGIVLQMVGTNPWLGFGPANYYHYTTLFPIWGWWIRFNSHNNYVDILGQTGILGLTAFAWFGIEAYRLSLKLWRHLPNGFAKAYVAGALGGLTGMLVAGMLADWIIPFAYNIGLRGFRSSLLFWFFLGGLVSLRRLAASGAFDPAPDSFAPARP